MPLTDTTVIRADSNPYIGGIVTFASGTNVNLSQLGHVITVNATTPVLTPGSVVFVGPAGELSEDPSYFTYDSTLHELEIGGPNNWTGQPNTTLNITADANSYCQVNFQNKNSGNAASTDFIVEADNDGVALEGHFADFGIAGSGWTPSTIGAVRTVRVQNGGTGYTVNDVITIIGGNSDATLTVLTVSGGVILTVSVTVNGTGYTVANDYAVTGGTGTGAIIDVLSLIDYSLQLANDGYLFVSGGNLVMGTDASVAGKIIKFHTGGISTSNERFEIADSGISTIASLGVERFTNFFNTSWTLGAGWAALTGSSTFLNKNANGTGTAVFDGFSPTIGVTYKVSYTVGANTASTGSAVIFGGLAITGFSTGQTGTFTTYVRANTAGKLQFTPNATATRFTITAVSIKAMNDATGDATIFGDVFIGSAIKSLSGNLGLSIDPNGALRIPVISGAVTFNAALSGITSIASTGAYTQTQANIQATSTDGLVLRNNQPATLSNQVQMSQRERFTGTAWDGSTTITADFINELLPIAGSGSITSALTWSSQIGGGGYTERMRLTSAGVLSVASLTLTTALTAANGGTGIASYTAGDLLTATGTTTLSKLAKGTANQILGMNNAATTQEYKSFGTIGTTGTAPAWALTVANTITLNIPMASASGVTAGLISKTEYDAFAASTGTIMGTTTDTQVSYGASSASTITSNAAFTYNVADDRFTIASAFINTDGIFFNGASAPNGLGNHAGIGIDMKAPNLAYTFGDVGINNNTHILVDDVSQTYTFSKLAGVATQMVTVSSGGILATAALPTGTIAGTIASNQVGFGGGTDTLSGSNNFTYNGSNLDFSGGTATFGSNFVIGSTGDLTVSTANFTITASNGAFTGANGNFNVLANGDMWIAGLIKDNSGSHFDSINPNARTLNSSAGNTEMVWASPGVVNVNNLLTTDKFGGNGPAPSCSGGNANSASVTAGNDLAGTLQINANGSTGAGIVTQVAFNSAYANPPRSVVLFPQDDVSATSLQTAAYSAAITGTGGFDVRSVGLTGAGIFTFSYIVIQ